MKSPLSVQAVCRMALLTAVTIVFSKLFSVYVTESIKVSTTFIPLAVCAMLMGPVARGTGGVSGGLFRHADLQYHRPGHRPEVFTHRGADGMDFWAAAVPGTPALLAYCPGGRAEPGDMHPGS